MVETVVLDGQEASSVTSPSLGRGTLHLTDVLSLCIIRLWSVHGFTSAFHLGKPFSTLTHGPGYSGVRECLSFTSSPSSHLPCSKMDHGVQGLTPCSGSLHRGPCTLGEGTYRSGDGSGLLGLLYFGGPQARESLVTSNRLEQTELNV